MKPSSPKEAWRNAEFVVSYKGSTAFRSAAYPTGTLHRPACVSLRPERREESLCPSEVFATTLEEFRANARSHAVGNAYRVCRTCCPDIVVEGRNMAPPRKRRERC